MKIDRAAFAEEIDADLPALKKALSTVAKEEREKEGTQRAKNAAMAQSDSSFSNGAGWLAASCSLGGLEELAGKIRPSGRRPGRTASGDEGGPGAPGDTSASAGDG